MRNFITIEGCDGVGKTYQTKMLRQYCEENGIDNIVFTREPGGSDIAEQIRKIILDANNSQMDDMCEAFLYAYAYSAPARYCKACVRARQGGILR